jgi:hypothetical protein
LVFNTNPRLIKIRKRNKKIYHRDTIPVRFTAKLAKTKGYSDAQLAFLLGRIKEDDVYERRKAIRHKNVYIKW